MKKIDATVLRETAYIAAWAVILSAVMQAVFLVGGWWDYTVLFGNLLSGICAVLNFFLMGLTVQKAITKEEKDAKNTMRLSQSLRTLFLFAIMAVGVSLPYFNMWSVLIPLIFPRIAIAFRGFFGGNYSGAEK